VALAPVVGDEQVPMAFDWEPARNVANSPYSCLSNVKSKDRRKHKKVAV